MEEEYGVGDGEGEEAGDIGEDVYNLLQNDAVFDQLFGDFGEETKNLDMNEGEIGDAL